MTPHFPLFFYIFFPLSNLRFKITINNNNLCGGRCNIHRLNPQPIQTHPTLFVIRSWGIVWGSPHGILAEKTNLQGGSAVSEGHGWKEQLSIQAGPMRALLVSLG